MIRNLKALGLALVAMLAMSAVAASSASANNITSNSGPYPKHLIGEDVGVADTFTVDSNSISCHGETYSATLNAPSTSIDATPEYGETCQTVGSATWNVTVTENGCILRFEWDSNVETDWDRVKVKVCPTTVKPIEIHHYSSTPHGSSSCTNTVLPGQTAIGTLDATSNTTSATTGDILLEGTVEVEEQTHGACSFGFTISKTAIFHATTTIRDLAGTRIHIGK